MFALDCWLFDYRYVYCKYFKWQNKSYFYEVVGSPYGSCLTSKLLKYRRPRFVRAGPHLKKFAPLYIQVNNIASGFMTVKCEAPVRSELDLSALGSQEKKIKRTCCNHLLK